LRRCIPILALFGVCGSMLVLVGAAGQPTQAAGYPCVSRPSDVRELGFSIRGKVGDVSVTPGQAVTKGQVLVRLEDSVQRVIVEYARLQAEDESNLKLSRSELEYRTKELELNEQARASQAGNDAQIREARYRQEQARIAVEAAQTQIRLRATDLARERAQLEQMSLLAPIDGAILDIRKRAGETTDEGTPVLTIVAVDPLWLDASVPMRDAGAIGVGQSASVMFEDLDGSSVMTGKVIYKAPAGNAGARQVQIRVEIPNPDKIPSGMHGRLTIK
jgi:membrane fusion protein, multidrug efflux system